MDGSVCKSVAVIEKVFVTLTILIFSMQVYVSVEGARCEFDSRGTAMTLLIQ